MARSETKAEAAGGGQDQPDIQPGEMVEIRLGRLESGEWYGQIGGSDDENAIAQTSAFPWEVLRGLAKQVKQADGALVSWRVSGEQQMGLCEHVSSDGRLCAVLQCPTGGAQAVAQALREGQDRLGTDFPQASSNEIVRLYGVMKEPDLKGKGEDGHLLTTIFEMRGDNLTPEFLFLNPSAKKQVRAIVYHAFAPPVRTDVPLGQVGLAFEGHEGDTVEVLRCLACLRDIHAAGQEPGMPCPICQEGTLEIVTVSAAEAGEQPADAAAEETEEQPADDPETSEQPESIDGEGEAAE